MRPRERTLLKRLGFSVPPASSTEATEVARAVRIAIDQAPPDSPFPPNIHGCVEVAAAMAWPAIARTAGLPSDDETAEAVMGYLLRGWWAMCLSFDRDHFESDRADWEAAQRLPELAQARKAESEALHTSPVEGL